METLRQLSDRRHTLEGHVCVRCQKVHSLGRDSVSPVYRCGLVPEVTTLDAFGVENRDMSEREPSVGLRPT